MKTISFINFKGGVGKTTISTNFAYALAESAGAKILFIDADKQGNSSKFFDVAASDKSLADIYINNTPAKDIIQTTRYKNIDIIPGNVELFTAHEDLIRQNNYRKDILKTALADSAISDKYDVCILDNPPDNGRIVLNSLGATDDVILITTPEDYSLDGVKEMASAISVVRAINPNLNLAGILFNQFRFSVVGFESYQELINNGYKIFNSRIGYASREKLNESIHLKKSIYEISPRSSFARELLCFTEEFISEK